MAANFRILYKTNVWDAGTVTESSDQPKRRGGNALLFHPGKSWRTVNDSFQWWVNDLGSAVNITCIGIFAHNLSASATVRLQANATDSWGSPTYDVVLPIATNIDGVVLPRIVFCLDETFRYWRLSIDDPTNPQNRIQIGRIVGGEFYEMIRQPQRDLRFTWKDPTPVEQKQGTIGNLPDDGDELSRYRQVRPAFPWRETDERRKWEAIFAYIGNSKPCVILLDYTNYPSEQSAYCWLLSDMDEVWKHSNKFDVLQLLFGEVTR